MIQLAILVLRSATQWAIHWGIYWAILVVSILAFSQVQSALADDWPMWRADPARSAATTNPLPTEWNTQWSRRFQPRAQAWDDPLNLDLMTYDRVFEPIVYNGLVCIGFNDQDKLVALDIKTGESVWTYYTEGPVRLPPVGYDGRIYFGSDDGFLYCVNAVDGSLVWKFRGAPNSQHALGNKRLTSAWPARGGPVVYDGDVYFAASIWPFMGTFIYSLDATTGEVNWTNDSTGSQYIKQPHSAPSFAGVAPQGAIVATDDYLVVPGGRSVPAVFDRRTGELKYFEINAGGKGTGGSFVTADDRHYFVHTREKGTRAFNLKTGLKTAFTPNEPVIFDGTLYSAETDGQRGVVRAYDISSDDNLDRKPLWELEVAGGDELILAGHKLVAASGHQLTIIDVHGDVPSVLKSIEIDALADGESIARLLVADQRVVVVGDKGTIATLGDLKKAHRQSPSKSIDNAAVIAVDGPRTEAGESNAIPLLQHGQHEGYAFWFGEANSPHLAGLIADSPFVQLAVVDHSEQRVHDLRVSLDERRLLGKVTGHVGTPQDFRAPSYVAHMIFTTPKVVADPHATTAMWNSVRPYGGTLTVVGADAEQRQAIAKQLTDLQLEQAKITTVNDLVVATRQGALPGSSDWTHQHGDIANTVKSDDKRVKLPLGILWFGGSSNMDVLPRHGHGPPEQVVGGRLMIQGMNSLSARDVYTGRVLWKREFKDLGTYDVFYDATYENTPLNPKYNQVHIPGANGRGTNYVVTEDRVYLLIGATCLMIDPVSGKDVGKIEMPTEEDGSQPEWGFIGVYEDMLLGGVGFANYREQHELEFAGDKELKRNRAGFGSKSFDRAASRGLIAFDRHSGKQRWRIDANHSFWHNGIVAGGGRLYCLDRNPAPVEEALRRRGLSPPDSYRIACFDAADGSLKWEVREAIFGTWLGYSQEHDLLLQAGAQGSDRLYAETGQGMRVYKAATGALHWKKDNLKYSGPCILHNDLIITNANSYSPSAGAFYIATGDQRMVRHPLTGELIPWKMTRAYGCNNIIASENLLTFRSGAAGYYDLTCDSGTGNLGGFKSGCTSNLVVANGVLNAPDYTRTCSCSYQNQTSLALVHMPDVEVWSVNALAATESVESTDDRDGFVENVGINFGAAGDRHDKNGTLWLEFPAKAGTSPPLRVRYNDDAKVYSQHASTRSGDPLAWVSSSGIQNIRELTIDLNLHEVVDLAKGISVAHPDDDAEEGADGDVSLGSSDLELTTDGDTQTIGLRFTDVPFPANSADRIKAAYLQFTVDESSDQSTSLWISGELTADAERFVSASHDVSSRDRTNAQVNWSPPAWKKVGAAGEAQRTPDLAGIVKEIVSQPDWKPGNAMAFIIGGEGKRTAVAGRAEGKGAARLVIIADVPNVSADNDEAAVAYTAELIFAAPRDAKQPLEFTVGDQQNARSMQRVVVSPEDPSAKILRVPCMTRGRQMRFVFDAKNSQAVLCGIKLKRE